MNVLEACEVVEGCIGGGDDVRQFRKAAPMWDEWTPAILLLEPKP